MQPTIDLIAAQADLMGFIGTFILKIGAEYTDAVFLALIKPFALSALRYRNEGF